MRGECCKSLMNKSSRNSRRSRSSDVQHLEREKRYSKEGVGKVSKEVKSTIRH